MTEESNVVLFPGMKREDAIPQTLAEMEDRITNARKEHVEMLLGDMIPELIHIFGTYGLNIEDDKYTKDIAMIMESIKSLLCKQSRLDHPFHTMVENVFECSYNEDNTIGYTYTLSNNEEE